MRLQLQSIATVFCNNKGAVNDNSEINKVYTDSRQSVKKGLFVPIVGERFDGHDFLMDAINNGATAALWEEGRALPAFIPNDFPIFFVKNTLTGLQELSKYYLNNIEPTVIGITGSNGKTTIKDLVDVVLKEKYLTHKTKGNYNNHIGLPLTILDMPLNTEVLILEMGMNHFGEISFLSQLAQPDYAIISNIGESHIEYLGSREGIAKAKMEIMDGLKLEGKIIFDGDEPLLFTNIVSEGSIRCGKNTDNDFILSHIHTNIKGVSFSVNETEQFELPMIGDHNAKNALFAIVLGNEMEIEIDEIKEALKKVEITGMRLERFKGRNGSLLINDAYNSSPTSMKAAIETVKKLDDYEKKIIVLGNMYELGSDEEELHRSVAQVIDSSISHVITVGDKAKWIANEITKKDIKIVISSFETKEEATNLLNEKLASDTVVLFKASRGVKLETIIDDLKQ